MLDSSHLKADDQEQELKSNIQDWIGTLKEIPKSVSDLWASVSQKKIIVFHIFCGQLRKKKEKKGRK